MKRCFMAVALGLLVFNPVLGAEKTGKEVKIIWHGQSYFEIISSKGTVVVTDPHAILDYGPIPGVRAHLILVSHLHNDHTQIQVVENGAKKIDKWPQAKVINGLKKAGLGEAFIKVNMTFKDVRVRSVATYHDAEYGRNRGKNTVFILEMDGIRIVHLGDLGHLLTKQQIKEIGPVDVLLIPVGGVYTINGDEAKMVVKQLKPKKYIIPMHCNTNAYDDLLPPKEFLEEQKNVAREDKLGKNLLTVKAAYKPAAPLIVVLNWESKIIPVKKKKKRDK